MQASGWAAGKEATTMAPLSNTASCRGAAVALTKQDRQLQLQSS